jgi:hypothetical protein
MSWYRCEAFVPDGLEESPTHPCEGMLYQMPSFVSGAKNPVQMKN